MFRIINNKLKTSNNALLYQARKLKRTSRLSRFTWNLYLGHKINRWLIIFLLSLAIVWLIIFNVNLPTFYFYQPKYFKFNIDRSRSNPRLENIYINVDETSESKLGMIHNDLDRQTKQIGFERYAFNSLVSERLGYRRSLPDTRHELCQNETKYRNEHYGNDYSMYNTSVIICFYNEELTALMRTVTSILDRTPSQVLAEILLIDDASESNLFLI